MKKDTIYSRIKNIFIGEAKNPLDQKAFHNISLVAFFAWVGLGSDGLSSSCYGPAEAFAILGTHFFLGLIIAVASAITILIIAESYSQINELFPQGGGGYYVASTLLSPNMGMIGGAALLIDYVLTIAISIASGADAIFSFLPQEWLFLKLSVAVFFLLVLIVMNLRGVKESVTILMPIFLTFVVSHVVIILYALSAHFMNFSTVVQSTKADVQTSVSQLGIVGLFVLLMRSYSMGAGTYTGIEAVSNGMPLLREPRVKTAKSTMTYMVISLASIVLGLMFAYAFYRVEPVAGKTLNAVLFDKVTSGWGFSGYIFVLVTLISEAAILFVASQAGFIAGPRVLANMAADRWLPKRFALLSDRLVTMNGVLIMGIGALIVLVSTNGSVGFLVVLYSINVFITFVLAQLGMVKHWWLQRKNKVKSWLWKIGINGVGLALCSFILVMMVIVKFNEGGWITLFITGSLIAIMLVIKHNYVKSDMIVKNLDKLVSEVESSIMIPDIPINTNPILVCDPKDRTAVIFVKDFTGVGIQTILTIFKAFGTTFKYFIFVQVGLIDAASFKDHEELEKVKGKVQHELDRYVNLMKRYGYMAEGYPLYGTDTVEEVEKMALKITEKYCNVTYFGGQIVFPHNSLLSRVLHNYTLFSIQENLYKMGMPVIILPIELPYN